METNHLQPTRPPSGSGGAKAPGSKGPGAGLTPAWQVRADAVLLSPDTLARLVAMGRSDVREAIALGIVEADGGMVPAWQACRLSTMDARTFSARLADATARTVPAALFHATVEAFVNRGAPTDPRAAAREAAALAHARALCGVES